jgi:CRP-like cAMP-binding protein
MPALDLVDALRRSSVLAGLPDEVLGRLAACAKPVEVPAGEVIIAEGDPADAMYLVDEGELEVSKQIGDMQVPLATLEAGEPLGEVGLVNGRPRTATVRAVRDSRLLRIDAEAFEELLTAPGSARRLLATVSRRLEEQEVLVRQHARMATLGSLSAGLLHELNNPAAALRRSTGRLTAGPVKYREDSRNVNPSMGLHHH